MLARALAIAQEQDDPDLLADVECTIVRTETDAGRYDSAAAAHAKCTDGARSRTECGGRDAESTACVRRPRSRMRGRIPRRRSHICAQRSGCSRTRETTRGLQYHAVLTDLGGIYFRTSRFRETLELNERTARALDENGRGGTLGPRPRRDESRLDPVAARRSQACGSRQSGRNAARAAAG